ncbi:MAG: helix-turn-helix transcriptional regulator [Pyrinomonadaceae bacterium]
MNSLKRLLTPDETAEFLSISRARVYQLTREGSLPVIVLGGRQYRYDLHALDQMIAAKQSNGQSAEPQAAYG